MKQIITLAVFMALLIASLGSTTAPAAQRAKTQAPYVYRVGGAVVRYTIPAPVRLIPKTIACQRKLKAPPLAYVSASADNRRGMRRLEVPSLEVVMRSGRTVTFQAMWLQMTEDRWLERAYKSSSELYESCYKDLYDVHLRDDRELLPGARTPLVILAANGPVDLRQVRFVYAVPESGIPVKLQRAA